MPTYVYKFVESGETIEVQQGFHDDTLTEFAHPDTGEVMAVKKVFTPVGVTFKGSGFFKTDNRGKKPSSSGSSSSDSSSGSKGDSAKGTTDSASSGTGTPASSSTKSSSDSSTGSSGGSGSNSGSSSSSSDS